MKHLLLTTIAAVVLVGRATTQQPEPPIAKAPEISIYDAVQRGNIEAVKQHIAVGTDINAKSNTKSQYIPLFMAAFKGHKEIAELPIVNGADVNAKMENGKTPLDSARFHPKTADLLRKNGAKTGKELKTEGK
jgi:ankyrin repeat protein